MHAGCIMGSVGSDVFGVWPMLETKSKDISASAHRFLICYCQVPQFYESATLNHWSTSLLSPDPGTLKMTKAAHKRQHFSTNKNHKEKKKIGIITLKFCTWGLYVYVCLHVSHGQCWMKFHEEKCSFAPVLGVFLWAGEILQPSAPDCLS